MFTSTSNAHLAEAGAADVLIPLIRAAATIGFVIAPCSLGFVIIAVSEQLIRSIMVGDDPEMLVSDLQNQFPNAAIEVNENCDAGLVAKVVDLIERPAQALDLPLDIRGTDFQMRVADALQKVPAGSTGELHLFSRTNRRHCPHSSDRSASRVVSALTDTNGRSLPRPKRPHIEYKRMHGSTCIN